MFLSTGYRELEASYFHVVSHCTLIETIHDLDGPAYERAPDVCSASPHQSSMDAMMERQGQPSVDEGSCPSYYLYTSPATTVTPNAVAVQIWKRTSP